jgi:hypothetical protein
MDDETMFSLFDSLKREMEAIAKEVKQEIRFVRNSQERIEAPKRASRTASGGRTSSRQTRYLVGGY